MRISDLAGRLRGVHNNDDVISIARAEHRWPAWRVTSISIIGMLIAVAGTAVLMWLKEFFNSASWDEVRPFMPRFVDGLRTTATVTATAASVTVAASLALAMARRMQFAAIRLSAGAIIEFFRGTSALVQLFWVFYALPLIPGGVQLTPFTAAVLVLGINWGSYGSEIVRGALDAVPRGQLDAADALGVGPWRRFRVVQFPQALPLALPPFATLLIDLLKNTAIVGFVLLEDLTYWAQQARVATRETTTIYTFVLLLYFAMAMMLSLLFRWLEARVSPSARDGAANEESTRQWPGLWQRVS